MRSPGIDQSIFLFAAFWLAVASFRGPYGMRFILGLALGAGLCRVAWAGLHFHEWLEAPWSLVDTTGGFCVLALPLGLLLVAPYGTSPKAAQAYRASAARALAPALAMSRIGCCWLGCCGGLASGIGFTHPVAAYEVLGWTALAFALRRVSDAHALGLCLFTFGALRLFLEPLRATPNLGEAFCGDWLDRLSLDGGRSDECLSRSSATRAMLF